MQKEYKKVIEEFWDMEPGVIISNPDYKIWLSKDLSISRRALKHIVERRKLNKYSVEKISIMISRIPTSIEHANSIIPNSTERYPNGKIAENDFVEEEYKLLIIFNTIDGENQVVSAYYRKLSK